MFPGAIVRTFNAAVSHKTTAEGFMEQLRILRNGVLVEDNEFAKSSCGTSHDRLDALLSALVASMDHATRIAFGDGHRDTIWAVRPSTYRDV